MASIKEIAKLAGVSPTTTSVVLNGNGEKFRISSETQQRILEAARTLDYSPNISARRLRSGGDTVSPILALFWTLDTRTSLMGPFLKGVQAGMQSLDTEHELLIQPYIGSQIKNVRSLITGTRFNGAIIANATEEDELYLSEANLNVPIVLFHRSSEKYCYVNADNYHSGQEVARLLSSRGHKRIGLIVPEVSSSATRLRKEGYLNEAKSLGIEVRPEHTVGGDFSEEGGYLALKTLLRVPEPPTALFALSDQMAIGALLALRESGIEVPRDMEIVGHDDYENARFAIPPLTTIHLPVEQMASACVHMLVDLMRHHVEPAASRIFEPYLVIRESCGDFIKN